MKNLLACVRTMQKNFDKNNYIVRDCEGKKFFGEIHIHLNDGKIIFTKNMDNNNGVVENIKL